MLFRSVSVGDSDIASLDGELTLRGLAVGSTTLSISSAPSLSVQTSVAVSDSIVELSELQVLLVTGVTWQVSAPVTVPLVPASASFSAVVQLLQQLDAEGDEAKLYVFAAFSDGATQQVPAAEVELTSDGGQVLLTNATASEPAKLTVAVGASAYVGSVVTAAWRVGAQTIGSGAGWANLTLPLPIDVTATASRSRVAPPDDSASTSPISVSTSFLISVTVHYDNGVSTDFSSDARLNVSLGEASAACASVQQLAEVVVGAGADCTSIEVLVTVPALSPALFATVVVPVVRLQALQLSTVPFPSFSGSSSHTLVKTADRRAHV